MWAGVSVLSSAFASAKRTVEKQAASMENWKAGYLDLQLAACSDTRRDEY
jgi:hypothetical protein